MSISRESERMMRRTDAEASPVVDSAPVAGDSAPRKGDRWGDAARRASGAAKLSDQEQKQVEAYEPIVSEAAKVRW